MADDIELHQSPRERILVHSAIQPQQPTTTSPAARPAHALARGPLIAAAAAATSSVALVAQRTGTSSGRPSPSAASLQRSRTDSHRRAPPISFDLALRTRAAQEDRQRQQQMLRRQQPLLSYPQAVAVPHSTQPSAADAGAPAITFVASNGTRPVRTCHPPFSSTNPAPSQTEPRPGNSRLLRYLNHRSRTERLAATGLSSTRRDPTHYRRYRHRIESIGRRIERSSEDQNYHS